MADLDPLGIVNSDIKQNPDGSTRRANESVTRTYMQFGKCHIFYNFFFLNQNFSFLSISLKKQLKF